MSTERMSTFEKRTRGYLALPSTITNDGRLSFKALGILTYLLSRPDDWRPNYRQLEASHVDGEASVLSGLRELEEAGYYTRRKVRHPDGTFRWVTTVFESPCLGNPGMDDPALENPGSTNDSGRMTEDSGEEEAYASPSPRKLMANPIWDALEGAFGPASTAPERRRRGLTTKELRQVGATPEQVEAAVKRHRRIWPKVTCTERSIVAHWTELTKVDPVDAERAAHNARMKKAREENGS